MVGLRERIKGLLARGKLRPESSQQPSPIAIHTGGETANRNAEPVQEESFKGIEPLATSDPDAKKRETPTPEKSTSVKKKVDFVSSHETDERINGNETTVELGRPVSHDNSIVPEATSKAAKRPEPPEKVLYRQFKARIRQEEFDTSKEFIPRGCVDDLTRPENVHRVLRPHQESDEETSRIVDFVTNTSKPARQIFLISIASGFSGSSLSEILNNFLDAEFCDHSLPITDENGKKPLFWDNDIPNYNTFEDKQWLFLAPVFNAVKAKHVLPAKTPLPFIYIERRVAKGGFGVVHKVTVHEAHRAHKVFAIPGSTGDVALKEVTEPGLTPGDSQTDSYGPVEGGGEQEDAAWRDLQTLKHPHIIEYIATIHRGQGQHYLMFRWANGRDLGTYWTENPNPTLSAAFVKAVIKQFRGLMDGLDQLHNCDEGKYRHTDIKPANILRFIDDVELNQADIGTLKISDMGLAKKHTMPTSQRKGTKARAATTRYQPPEVDFKLTEEGIGRRYDIWSMGCVMLELVIWLLHGYDTLNLFNNTWLGIQPGSKDAATPYYERMPGDLIEVHSNVSSIIQLLLEDPECQGKTALGDLIRLVRDKMLVVGIDEKSDGKSSSDQGRASTLQVPSQRQYQPGSPGIRAVSGEVCQDLDNILRHAGDDTYWFTGKGRGEDTLRLLMDPRPVQEDASSDAKPQDNPSFEVVITGEDGRAPSSPSSNLSSVANRSYGQTRLLAHLDNVWKFSTDNKFAVDVLQGQNMDVLFPASTGNQLCESCKNMDLTRPSFVISDTWAGLEATHTTCDFCNMRLELCKSVEHATVSEPTFERHGSGLKLKLLGDDHPPILAISRGPANAGLVGQNDHHIQTGFPHPPSPNSAFSYHLARQWLRHCDEKHIRCRPSHRLSVPTRLLDLGNPDDAILRIYVTQPGDSMSYIALSHPWGPQPHFCTLTTNIEEYKQKVDFAKLPATFKDAITITRHLGHRYIWIDSLCIIQGEGGDFDQEATRMESIFSSAYCVVAASRAHGQNDGFLTECNHNRKLLTFPRQGLSPLYISEFIDNFAGDVLDSYLNHRGWVFQERALARRTIYFTDTQMYWECGDGVRCQSLTRMTNDLASFMGDPNFPSKLSDGSSQRGEKILYYENLYYQYTRLNFTHPTDRAVAILGIQERLIRDLGAKGGFGTFDDGRSLLQHSLLWMRGREYQRLTKIDFGPDRLIPSWSWMGYNEGIDFLDLPLGDVKWLPDEIVSPWSDPQKADTSSSYSSDARSLEISILAREFQAIKEEGDDGEHELFYDSPDPNKAPSTAVRCVLMGKVLPSGKRDRRKPDAELTHCVLFVEPKPQTSPGTVEIYERVGVGFLAGRFIELSSPGILVKLR